MRITTFNLRVKCNEKDPNNYWEKRLPRIEKQLGFIDSDLYGFQELTQKQYDDVSGILLDYDSVFCPRDNKEAEGTPVFYKKSKFELITKGSYFLNEHPDTPGVGWDACCWRVASYATLKEKKSGKIFTFFNTHLDHVGKQAQIKGIELMVKKMSEVGGSMFLTGDFNVYETDVTYEKATTMLKDSKYIAKQSTSGNTFHNYGAIPFDKNIHPIDYIMVSDDVKVLSYNIYAKEEQDGFASDHYAVYADVEL
ncbi:MAG: endonuclease/exonuclease/phosphatase family protein [Clostridiales bacterium]|nr:endonuclease/exonuclease/phosphatase family protein [Clostridiales bacterium]